jgi:aspartate racemase
VSLGRVGLIGGLGPESTVAYYRLLTAQRVPLVINSVDLDRVVALVTADLRAELTDYLSEEIDVLRRAGATMGLITANTPHIVFDDLRARSSIRLISIVEAACAAVQKRGLKRVGLLGTGFTMRGRFYPDVFSRAGIAIVVPNQTERASIHAAYMNELLKDVFLPKTRDLLLAVIGRLSIEDHVEAVLLAGTELPLILPDGTPAAVPLIDTAKTHVAAALKHLGRVGVDP